MGGQVCGFCGVKAPRAEIAQGGACACKRKRGEGVLLAGATRSVLPVRGMPCWAEGQQGRQKHAQAHIAAA